MVSGVGSYAIDVTSALACLISLGRRPRHVDLARDIPPPAVPPRRPGRLLNEHANPQLPYLYEHTVFV